MSIEEKEYLYELIEDNTLSKEIETEETEAEPLVTLDWLGS